MAQGDEARPAPSVKTISVVPQEHTITHWQEVAGFAHLCVAGDWIFRGESYDPENPRPLRPTAGRDNWNKEPYSLEKEKEALALFKRKGRPMVGHEPKSDLEWLAVAQHHGMPTRLLDWTESLFVAAYFATMKMNTSGGIIYGVRDLQTASELDEQFPFAVPQPCVYRPPHISPRIAPQSSAFTLHPNPRDAFQPSNLYRWKITPDAAAAIKPTLDVVAINEASLFPNLDGLARSVGWRYKWGKP